MHVVVIGAGLIGCASAYALQRAGHTVELVDACNAPGMESSFANGAQLSYSYVEPLANPATLRGLPKMLFERESALQFKPQWDWRQWAWSWDFLRACTQKRAAHGTQALLTLAELSRQTLQGWMQDEPHWDIQFARNGKLVICRDEAMLERQARQVAMQALLGSQQQVLTREQCFAQEPALKRSQFDFAGGIWTASEDLADPHLLCQALAASLVQRGGQLRMAHHVQSFDMLQGKPHAVRTDRANLRADAFVIAAGTSSASLAAQLGIHVPVYPIKGYSITLPVRHAQHVAKCSITDLGRKTVFAPLGGNLRVAAAAELVGHDRHVNPERVAQMLRSVELLMPGACDVSQPQTWAGLRPATPDSLPIIAASRIPGVFINTGQGALGLTLAAGSAQRLSALMPV